MSQALWAAAALVCPVGMGTMMWMMMRGNRRAAPADENELGRLRAELDELKSQRGHEI